VPRWLLSTSSVPTSAVRRHQQPAMLRKPPLVRMLLRCDSAQAALTRTVDSDDVHSASTAFSSPSSFASASTALSPTATCVSTRAHTHTPARERLTVIAQRSHRKRRGLLAATIRMCTSGPAAAARTTAAGDALFARGSSTPITVLRASLVASVSAQACQEGERETQKSADILFRARASTIEAPAACMSSPGSRQSACTAKGPTPWSRASRVSSTASRIGQQFQGQRHRLNGCTVRLEASQNTGGRRVRDGQLRHRCFVCRIDAAS
jgi:hypothetical protein